MLKECGLAGALGLHPSIFKSSKVLMGESSLPAQTGQMDGEGL